MRRAALGDGRGQLRRGSLTHSPQGDSPFLAGTESQPQALGLPLAYNTDMCWMHQGIPEKEASKSDKRSGYWILKPLPGRFEQ